MEFLGVLLILTIIVSVFAALYATLRKTLFRKKAPDAWGRYFVQATFGFWIDSVLSLF